MPAERMCQYHQRYSTIGQLIFIQRCHGLAHSSMHPIVGSGLLATASTTRGQLAITNRITQSTQQQGAQTSCPQIRRIVGRLQIGILGWAQDIVPEYRLPGHLLGVCADLLELRADAIDQLISKIRALTADAMNDQCGKVFFHRQV